LRQKSIIHVGLASTLFLFLTFIPSDICAGNRGFNFLRTPPGARPAAMAHAFVAFTGDVNSIYYNPGALAGMSGKYSAFGYANSLLDIQSGFASYLMPAFKGNFAFTVYYKDYGELLETNELGDELGSFSASSLVTAASYSQKYDARLWVGGTAKFVHSNIFSLTANAFAFDAGFYYDSVFLGNLKIGGGIFNVGQALTSFVDIKDKLPTRVEVGVSKMLAHLPFTYSIALQKYFDDDFQFAAGGEFIVSEGLFLRFGYNSLGKDQKTGASGESLAGVSAGFGLNLKKYKIDYAISSLGIAGTENRFSISMTL